MNFQTLAFHAAQLLGRIQPDALCRPEPVDLRPLLDAPGRALGLTVVTRDMESEAYYEPEFSLIALRPDLWDALLERSDATHRARSTFAHELGHWNLDGISVAENDAWAHAGCMMMPCEMVQSLDQIDDVTLSRVFDVSPQFAYRHLWRMKRARMI